MTDREPRVGLVFGTPSAGEVVLGGPGATAPPGVTLVRVGAGFPGHRRSCPCCRPLVSKALTALFHARARGELPFFRRLTIDLTLEAAVRQALTEDTFVAARYAVVSGLD